MWAASLGRGPKLNEIQISEDGEVLERQRREWLRRLEVPHGRSASSMPHALWEPSEKLARVTRDKGRDLTVLGFHAKGSQWLRPEEALCLLEDSLLAISVLYPDGTQVPLSVQEFYRIVIGGPTPLVDHSVYSVFIYLFRANFVSRPHSMGATADGPSTSAGADGPPSAPELPPPSCADGSALALFDVYHRGSFSRRAVAEGRLLPLYAVAVFRAPDRMPPMEELARLRHMSRAGTPLRCACAWQQDVLFFDIGYPKEASRVVHGPMDVDTKRASGSRPRQPPWHCRGNDPGEHADEAMEDEAEEAETEQAASAEADAGADSAVAMTADATPAATLGATSAAPPADAAPGPSPPCSPPAPSGGFIIAGEDDEEADDAGDHVNDAGAWTRTVAVPAEAVRSVTAPLATDVSVALGSVPVTPAVARAVAMPSSRSENRMRALSQEASCALERAMAARGKDAATALEASAASTSRVVAEIEQSAVDLASTSRGLHGLASAIGALRDPDREARGNSNSSLWSPGARP